MFLILYPYDQHTSTSPPFSNPTFHPSPNHRSRYTTRFLKPGIVPVLSFVTAKDSILRCTSLKLKTLYSDRRRPPVIRPLSSVDLRASPSGLLGAVILTSSPSRSSLKLSPAQPQTLAKLHGRLLDPKTAPDDPFMSRVLTLLPVLSHHRTFIPYSLSTSPSTVLVYAVSLVDSTSVCVETQTVILKYFQRPRQSHDHPPSLRLPSPIVPTIFRISLHY